MAFLALVVHVVLHLDKLGRVGLRHLTARHLVAIDLAVPTTVEGSTKKSGVKRALYTLGTSCVQIRAERSQLSARTAEARSSKYWETEKNRDTRVEGLAAHACSARIRRDVRIPGDHTLARIPGDAS